MLFDARRALPQVNQDILAAADYIRENGWTRGQMFAGRAACIAGALLMMGDGPRFVAAYSLLQDRLRARRHWGSAGGWGSVGGWNDEPGRTGEEVIATLEEIGWSA